MLTAWTYEKGLYKGEHKTNGPEGEKCFGKLTSAVIGVHNPAEELRPICLAVLNRIPEMEKNGIYLSPEMEKDGIYLSCRTEGETVSCLVDTRAIICLVRPDVFFKLPKGSRPTLKRDGLYMILADDKDVPVLGVANVELDNEAGREYIGCGLQRLVPIYSWCRFPETTQLHYLCSYWSYGDG